MWATIKLRNLGMVNISDIAPINFSKDADDLGVYGFGFTTCLMPGNWFMEWFNDSDRVGPFASAEGLPRAGASLPLV